jgi:hypothetical protein
LLALVGLLVIVRRARRTGEKPAEPRTTKGDATRAQRESPASQPAAELAPCALILANEEHRKQLSAVLDIRCMQATTASEVAELVRGARPVAAFVDVDLVGQLGNELSGVPIVGVVDENPSETLSKVVRSLDAVASLSHFLSANLLPTPLARSHVRMLLDRLANGPEHDMVGAEGVGRVAMLARASHREARFERMRQYFTNQGLSQRTISAVQEVAEELVMNALYNAPAEAGFFKTPVSRTEDVELPPERACEISYGMDDGNAFVRTRDTFGALRRERLAEVLSRCNAGEGVPLDESRGGAGLGMWRIFSAATSLAITVVPGRLTDILVRIAPKQGRNSKQLQAVHLFFVTESSDDESFMFDQNSGLVDRSITLLFAP